MDRQTAVTYCMLGFAMIGMILATTDPFGLDLIYAQTPQIEKGYNYDKQILETFPDGSISVQWTSTPPRILDGVQYLDYKFTDTVNDLIVETEGGSVVLNKSGCGFNFHNRGFVADNPNPLFSDSIIAFDSTVDLYDWNEVTQVNNASCEVSFDSDNVSLTAKRHAPGIGTMEYKYILVDGKWKTQLEATNLTSLTNRVFAFDQTIDLNRDSIKFGGSIVNLDNQHGVTFGRTWLENNEANVIDLLNGFDFDFDLGFEILDSVTITDTGINKSKLTFHYMRNNDVLMPGNTLIIDPTFGYTAGTSSGARQLGTTCAAGYDKVTSHLYYAASSYCSIHLNEWDISSIPDPSTISTVNVKYDISSASTSYNCDFHQLNDKPTLLSAQDAFLQGTGSLGVPYATGTTDCKTAGNDKVTAFNSNAVSEIQSRLTNGDWFATSIEFGIMPSVPSGTDSSYPSNMRLQITYTTPPPDAPAGLSCSALPYEYGCSWTAINASYVTGYFISHSYDNSTWSLFNITSIGNVTSYDYGVFGILESNYIRVNATDGVGNGTSSNVVFQTTDDLPDAPGIIATSISETQIDILRTAGASDGGDSITHFDIRGEINSSGSWDLNLSNQTIAGFYNHTGLSSGDDVVYQWRDRNNVGYSSWSGNSSATTYEDIIASLTIDVSNVGDTFNATGVLTVSNSSPLPVSISLLELISNGTTVTTDTPSNTFNIETDNIAPIWFTVPDGDLRQFTLNATLTNGVDTVEIASGNTESFAREYDPVYVAALTPGIGNLNYTIARDATTIELKMNRDIGGTWKSECIYRTLSDALSETGGTWNNQTMIGYYHDIQTVPTTAEPYYISCYNDSLLFTTVSYLSSTNSLVLGLSIFDELGGFFGAPSVILVILALLSLATGRNFPIVLLISASVTGILLALQLITLDPGLVVALIVLTGIGLFGIRKFY